MCPRARSTSAPDASRAEQVLLRRLVPVVRPEVVLARLALPSRPHTRQRRGEPVRLAVQVLGPGPLRHTAVHPTLEPGLAVQVAQHHPAPVPPRARRGRAVVLARTPALRCRFGHTLIFDRTTD